MNSYLYNDNCMNVFKTIGDETVDLVVTDCPYKIIAGGSTPKRKDNTGGMLSHAKKTTCNGKLFLNNEIEFSEWLPEVYRILRSGCHAYVMINARNLKDLWTAAENAGFEFQQLIIWDKGNLLPNRFYMNAYELILMLRKGRARAINNKGESNIIRVPNSVSIKTHPTEKPPKLMKILIENSTNFGQLVIDPFMGTGATGVACKMTGRDFIGIEIDKSFFDIAKNRIDADYCPAGQMSLFDYIDGKEAKK